MRLVIGAVGRLKAGPEREMVARYVERLNAVGRGVALGPLAVAEIDESRAGTAEQRMAEEGRLLLAALGNAKTVVLDERAPTLSSDRLAERIAAALARQG